MRACFDQNGYAYECDQGYYLSLYYDEEGFAYDAATGEKIDEVVVDTSWNGTVYTGGGGINWNEVIRTAAQAYAAGEGAAQSGRYIPTQGSESQAGYRTMTPGGATITGGVNRGGLGAGLNISTNTLMLIVGGFLLFMLGSKRGR